MHIQSLSLSLCLSLPLSLFVGSQSLNALCNNTNTHETVHATIHEKCWAEQALHAELWDQRAECATVYCL